MGNALSITAAIAVPLLGGTVIGIGMRNDVKGWYQTIKKPTWTPPNWLFGPVWSLLYTMIGVASWRVYAAGGGALPLGLYATQLLLNFAWSPLFFKAHRLDLAAYDITALAGMIVATIVAFNKVDPMAAALMVPYLGWSSFATALTWNIYTNNPDQRKGTGVYAALSEATAAASTPFLAHDGLHQSDRDDDVVDNNDKEQRV